MLWRIGQSVDPVCDNRPVYRPEFFETIQATTDSLSDKLRALSLDISDHPEIKFEEYYAHDVLTSFISQYGFQVTKNYLLPTGWSATFTHGKGGRTIGVNSEMDALPGIGHACGHNLIAIAGIAVACGLKAAMEKWDIPGKIVLLGTPAEEGGCGKVRMLEQGGYEGMDICLMCHPAPGPPHGMSLSGSLALTRIQVEFIGHTAHAALSPWEGQNALDAAVLAYMNISALRQQLKPSHRVHGIIQGRDWAVNIIPDYAKMNYYVRAPTKAEVEAALPRVIACFNAAALATSCKVEIDVIPGTADIRQNEALGDELANVSQSKYGPIDYVYGIRTASTDFGDITYALPSLHPGFSIPTEPNGGNHTVSFANAARSVEAHKACLNTSVALAATGVRVLTDDTFFEKVRKTFEEDLKVREG